MVPVRTNARQGTRAHRQRRLVAILGSAALIALFAGNVTARQLIGDDRGAHAPLVTPKLEARFTAQQQLARKLATTAGRDVLIYG